MSKTDQSYIDDICPKCRKSIMQADIERHPTRSDLAIQNFQCTDCGPVKAKIFALKPSDGSPAATA
jgi:phage FluMu protein Com